MIKILNLCNVVFSFLLHVLRETQLIMNQAKRKKNAVVVKKMTVVKETHTLMPMVKPIHMLKKMKKRVKLTKSAPLKKRTNVIRQNVLKWPKMNVQLCARLKDVARKRRQSVCQIMMKPVIGRGLQKKNVVQTTSKSNQILF